jgi:hypothetical protein
MTQHDPLTERRSINNPRRGARMKIPARRAALVATLLFACPLAASAQKAGYDLLQTPSPGASIDLGRVVCAPGQRCHPFPGIPVKPQRIALKGVPICACTGATDTIMYRTQEVAANGEVPLSVVALFLKNSDSVTLEDGTPVDVYITVNHSNGVIGQSAVPQPDLLPESTGQLTVHPNGTFDSTIHVIADVIVVPKGAGADAKNPKIHQRGPEVDLMSSASPWSSSPPAGYPAECFFPGNGFYPGGSVAETAPSHSHPVVPAVDPTGFSAQPSYHGDCKVRTPGKVCAEYEDGYIWLIDESVTAWQKNQDIQAAIGAKHEFLHILKTNLVKEVPKP